LLGTRETQWTPAAPTTGAKREGQLNDEESWRSESWESDGSIITRGKALAAPKRAKGQHLNTVRTGNQRRKNDGT
jgi:hypothetical protein